MSQPNQNDTTPRRVSSKRTNRGRPRKYPRPGEDGFPYITLNPTPTQNEDKGNDALIPPGFENVIQNQPRQKNNSSPIKVGDRVPATIEGEFDGGYWVSVKIGNSNPSLRGIVFRPGSYVTVKPDENNIALGVPLIPPRNVANLAPAQVQNPIPNERNEEQNVIDNTNETIKRNESPLVTEVAKGAASSGNNLGASSLVKNVSSVVAQTTDLLGKMVPLVYRPANLSTGVLTSLEKGKSISNRPSPAVLTRPPFSLRRGTIITSNTLASGRNQAGSAENQNTSQNMLSKQSENHQSSAKVVDGTAKEATLMKQASMPFDFGQLVKEVVNRIRTRSDFEDTVTGKNKSGGKATMKDSKGQEVNVIDLDELDDHMPMQTEQSGPSQHSASSPRPSKMTSSMQEKKMGNQDGKTKELRTELDDGGSGQSTKRFRALNMPLPDL